MDRISSIDISASGMRAQRLRMELIANNLANVETTSARQEVVRTPEGDTYIRHTPYRRKVALFQPGIRGQSKTLGVTAVRVVEDHSDFRQEFNPGHEHAVRVPGAEDFGRLYLPNVNPMIEMVDMISASRSYEANVTAVDAFKAMGQANLRILA